MYSKERSMYRVILLLCSIAICTSACNEKKKSTNQTNTSSTTKTQTKAVTATKTTSNKKETKE